MAIGTSVTLQDIARRLDPNGKVDKIVEVINKTNEVLDDIHWEEGSLTTGDITTRRTSLPSGTFRKVNQGIDDEKSTTEQVRESCAMLESYSQIDVEAARQSGNPAQFRETEFAAFLAGMGNTIATTMVYGNEATDPEEFTGFAPRYNSTTCQYSRNVVTGTGTGSTNTSIYLVVWGPHTVKGIYPKGTKAGIDFTDKGIQTVLDANHKKLEAYLGHFIWYAGLSVKNPYSVVRIANISATGLATAGSDSDTSDNLINLMTTAYARVKDMALGRPSFLMNATAKEALMKIMENRPNVMLRMEDYMNRPNVLRFRGIPCREVEGILDTETAIS
jgi:hypothetical protein